MNDLMKQARKMQEEMMKSQQELENKIFSASSGGGMVTVEINGKYELKSIKIDPEAVDPEDVEMLEDLVIAAMMEAHSKVTEANEKTMNRLAGGMKIPGLF